MEKKSNNLDILQDHGYLVFDRTDNKVGFMEKDGRTLEQSLLLFKNQNGSKATGGFIGNRNKRYTDNFNIKNVVVDFLNFPKKVGLFKQVDGVVEKVTVSGKTLTTNMMYVDEELHENLTNAIQHLLGLKIKSGDVIELDTDVSSVRKLKAFDLKWIGNSDVQFEIGMDTSLKFYNNESFKSIVGMSDSYDGTSIKNDVIFKYYETEIVSIDNSDHNVVRIPIKLSLFGLNQ